MKFDFKKLAELRTLKSVTLEEVAAAVGCDVSSVSVWEDGKRTPGPKFRRKLAKFYGVEAAAFFEKGVGRAA